MCMGNAEECAIAQESAGNLLSRFGSTVKVGELIALAASEEIHSFQIS